MSSADGQVRRGARGARRGGAHALREPPPRLPTASVDGCDRPRGSSCASRLSKRDGPERHRIGGACCTCRPNRRLRCDTCWWSLA